jgi:hypothetical protein
MEETAVSNAKSRARTQSQNGPVVNPGPYDGNCWLGVDRKLRNFRTNRWKRALHPPYKIFTCIPQWRE